MSKQYTIAKTISLSGLGVHTGKSVNVFLKPLPLDSGIIVNRIDLQSSFKVSADKIVSNNRNTTLGNDHCTVQTIEHFMFVFCMMGISNIEIQIDSEEFPIFDGSARAIVEAISSVGVIEQESEIPIVIVDKVYELRNEVSSVRIEPCDRFELDLTIDFPAKEIGVYNYVYKEGDDLSTVSVARTFVMLSELQYLIKKGLSQIEDINCAYIVRNIDPTDELINDLAINFKVSVDEVQIKLRELDQLANNDKEFIPRELAKHKVLDFIGDLYLINAQVKGRIVINKPGHFINGQIAKLLIGITN